MHPSNNLLLPILRKHGDRLLKAQIEAMVKELSWEEQELFLRRQLEASVEAIREKLATSYPDYSFLTEWEPEILKKSLKAWIFILSAQSNYLIGLDEFSLTISLIELGKPIQLTGYIPGTQEELWINQHGITRNGYKLKSMHTSDELNFALDVYRDPLKAWMINKRFNIKMSTPVGDDSIQLILENLYYK